MRISDEALDEFAKPSMRFVEIYREEFGEAISRDVALSVNSASSACALLCSTSKSKTSFMNEVRGLSRSGP
jgi:hypothetical protein